MNYGGPCHRCGKAGHVASNCSAPMVCDRCGQRGHTQKFCGRDQSRRSGGGGGTGGGSSELCHRCGRRGHFSRNCKFANNSCGTCGEPGHSTRECRGKGASMRAHKDARRHEKRLFHRERRSVALADSQKRQDREERVMRKELGSAAGGGAVVAKPPGVRIGVVPRSGVRVGVKLGEGGKRRAAGAEGGGAGPSAKKAKAEVEDFVQPEDGGGESSALWGLAEYGSGSGSGSDEDDGNGMDGNGMMDGSTLPNPAILLDSSYVVEADQHYAGYKPAKGGR